ncbi:MAG: LytTR family DNA-binding domain-containing protein [Gammaproteobacteria bacterium]
MSAEPASVLIVDDEPPARSRLRQLVTDLEGFHVIGEAGHGEEALSLCQSLRPDVVLLDIRMPGVDGLQVASQLAGWEQRPAVIFTTAYDEYAIQAFEAQAVGYLLKPVRRERLQQTLEHASRVGRAQLLRLPGSAPRTHICVQRPRGLQMLPVEDILCFQADQKYVTAHYPGGEALLDEPLKDLEDEFGDRFLRIHRNALIAVAWLDSLDQDEAGAWQVRLKADFRPLAVSRRHVGDVKRRLRAGTV